MQVRLLHTASAVGVRFDEPNLVSVAGLVPVMRLAQRCGLSTLVGQRVRIEQPARPVAKGNPGVNPDAKITSIVAGMVAGADSVEDMDLLRHGGTRRLFGGVYAPSSLGSHLRAYAHGHVRQLESAARGLLRRLAAQTPVLSGIERVCYLDLDDTRTRQYGHQKQGVGFGMCKVGGYQVRLRNLDALLATISTPTAAPVVAATRLRRGEAASTRGASWLLREAIGTAKACGADVENGLVLARGDAAFYNHTTVRACVDAGVRFSITVSSNPSIAAAIDTIGESAWIGIRYPEAVWDEQLACWISDAEVAEVPYTAFASKPDGGIQGRLIVRRVRRRGTDPAQGELLPAWRHHAVFSNNPMPLLEAERTHRGHAIVEQVFADLNDGPLAHLPSGVFTANAAWLVCAAMAHNLLRATGSLASVFHAKARGATLRRHLITIPARLATSARRLTLHLPEAWPWADAFEHLWTTVTRPPPTAPT